MTAPVKPWKFEVVLRSGVDIANIYAGNMRLQICGSTSVNAQQMADCAARIVRLPHLEAALEGALGALEYSVDCAREDGSNADIDFAMNKLNAARIALGMEPLP